MTNIIDDGLKIKYSVPLSNNVGVDYKSTPIIKDLLLLLYLENMNFELFKYFTQIFSDKKSMISLCLHLLIMHNLIYIENVRIYENQIFV